MAKFPVGELCQLRSAALQVLAKSCSRMHSKVYGRSDAQKIPDSSGSGAGEWGRLSFSLWPLALSCFSPGRSG